jgi:predicted nucleic acid-binding protein
MVPVVIDTNVFVAGMRSGGGASRQVLRRAVEGAYLPRFSNALWLEYEDVLGRPIWTEETSPEDRVQVLAALAAAGR